MDTRSRRARSKRLLALTQPEKERRAALRMAECAGRCADHPREELDAVVRALTEPSRPMEERQALPPLALDQLRDAVQED